MLEQELLLRTIRKAFGIPVGPISGELSLLPVLNLGDADGPPYHSKRGGSRFVSIDPGAAEIGHVQLQVPDDERYDGLVRVVRWFTASSNGAVAGGDWFDWALSPLINLPEDVVATAVSIVGVAWDQPEEETRAYKFTHPHFGAYANAAGLATKAGSILMPQWNTAFIPGPFVIRRGAALDICNTTVDRYIGVTMYWDDYDLSA